MRSRPCYGRRAAHGAICCRRGDEAMRACSIREREHVNGRAAHAIGAFARATPGIFRLAPKNNAPAMRSTNRLRSPPYRGYALGPTANPALHSQLRAWSARRGGRWPGHLIGARSSTLEVMLTVAQRICASVTISGRVLLSRSGPERRFACKWRRYAEP